MLRYAAVLIPDPETGVYTVIVPSLPGVITEGDSYEDALANAKDAISLHLRGLHADNDYIPVEPIAPIMASVDVTVPEVEAAIFDDSQLLAS